MREKIILSDLDLSILHFLKDERFIKEIVKEFDIDYLMMKFHLDRLRKLQGIDTKKFGTFKKIKINRKGIEILKLIKNGFW